MFVLFFTFKTFLYILEISPLSNMCFKNIVSQSVACDFHSLNCLSQRRSQNIGILKPSFILSRLCPFLAVFLMIQCFQNTLSVSHVSHKSPQHYIKVFYISFLDKVICNPGFYWDDWLDLCITSLIFSVEDFRATPSALSPEHGFPRLNFLI